MSGRARHAQTGRFVKTVSVRPAWPALDKDVQEALAAHVFTGAGAMPVTRASIFTGNTATQHATMRVDVHVQLASRVCKAWKHAFDEWLPRGIADASARAWAWAIAEGLDKCQYSAYVQHTIPGVPYLSLHSFLPRQTKVEWRLFLHDKALGTLTLTRRLQDVVGDGEVVEGVEHVLNVTYKPVREVQLPGVNMEGNATIHIPDECWTEAGVLRGEGGESVVEKWTREKAAFLERWVLMKHGRITRDWPVLGTTGAENPFYYWG